MPVIYETDEDKYYDKEDIKKLRKGNQSGIESRGSGIFLPGTKHGNGLYLPSRQYEGDGIIDSIISVGKSVIEGIANNSSTIGNVASAVGSVAGATANVADVVKAVKDVTKKNKLEEWHSKNKANLERVNEGNGFKIT